METGCSCTTLAEEQMHFKFSFALALIALRLDFPLLLSVLLRLRLLYGFVLANGQLLLDTASDSRVHSVSIDTTIERSGNVNRARVPMSISEQRCRRERKDP